MKQKHYKNIVAMVKLSFFSIVGHGLSMAFFISWLLFGKHVLVGVAAFSGLSVLALIPLFSPIFGWWYIEDDVIYYSVALFWSKKMSFDDVSYIERQKGKTLPFGWASYCKIHAKSKKQAIIIEEKDEGLEKLLRLHRPREIMEL